jgi:hypothetical protein
VEKFFAIWSRRFKELVDAEGDQAALVDAVFLSDCRLLSLDRRWNGGWGATGSRDRIRPSTPSIVHYTSVYTPELTRDLLQLDDELERQGFPAAGNDLSAVIAEAGAWRLQKEGRMSYYWKRRKWLTNSLKTCSESAWRSAAK